MRPIEFLHSVEQLPKAEQLQSHLKQDPYHVTGNLNIQEMLSHIAKQNELVPHIEPKDFFDSQNLPQKTKNSFTKKAKSPFYSKKNLSTDKPNHKIDLYI